MSEQILTEFGAYPKHWDAKTILTLQHEKLMLVEDGNHGNYRPLRNEFASNGICYIKAGDIDNNQVLFESSEKINQTAYSRLRKGKSINGDTIITHKGTVGKVAYISKKNPFPHVCSPQTTFYRSLKESEISSRYIFYYLISPFFQNQFDSRSGESDMAPYVSLTNQRDLLFLMPPISEQELITEVLSSLDDKRDLLHRQNQTLEQMAETLFRQWFVEEAEEGWEWHQLAEFVDVQRGLSYKGAGLTDAENGIPMHNLNSVFEGGGYKEAGIKYYNGDFKERHKVFPGDVIITNTEQGHEHLLIGYPAIVPSNFGEYGIFSQHIYRLEIKSRLSNFFLFHLLKTNDVHEQIAGATNGSTVNMLSKDGVDWVKFKLPPQNLIDNFSQIASDHYIKQELNQTQIRTLTALRDTLLPKLMSGEVRVVMDATAKMEEA